MLSFQLKTAHAVYSGRTFHTERLTNHQIKYCHKQTTTTPERPPFRDLRIVTDPAQLRYLEQLHHSSVRGGGSDRGSSSVSSSDSSDSSSTYTVMIKPATNVAHDYNSTYYANHPTHGTTNLTSYPINSINYATNNNTNTNTDEYSYYTNATRQDYASALLDEFNSHTHTSTHSNTPANTPNSTSTSSTGTSTTINTNTTSNKTLVNPAERTHTNTTNHHTYSDNINITNNTNTTDTMTTSTTATILQQLVHSVWEAFSPNNQEPTPMDTTYTIDGTMDTADTTTLPKHTTNNTTYSTNPTNNTAMTSSTSRASIYKGSSMDSLAYSDTTNNSLPMRV